MKHKDLYSFPLKSINDFLDKEIDKKLEEFYKSFQNEFFGSRILSINRERKEVRFLKDCFTPGEEEFVIHSFESDIKFIINNLIYNVLDTISEGMNICFISDQSIYIYLERLERQYNILIQSSKIKQYPFLNAFMELIKHEINRYKNIDGVSILNINFKKSPFKPKDRTKLSFFHRLYEIAIDHNIIADDFPKEDFIEVFTYAVTNKSIKFSCKTPLMILFFQEIKDAFDDLNAASVSKSKRFYTKQNTLITITNYDSGKNRITYNSAEEELKEDLEELLLDYI